MPAISPPSRPLTAEEIRILERVAHDWTDLRIARELGVSESTVRRRLRRVEEMLGAGSRTSAAVFAAKLGLINGWNERGRKRSGRPAGSGS